MLLYFVSNMMNLIVLLKIKTSCCLKNQGNQDIKIGTKNHWPGQRTEHTILVTIEKVKQALRILKINGGLVYGVIPPWEW